MNRSLLVPLSVVLLASCGGGSGGGTSASGDAVEMLKTTPPGMMTFYAERGTMKHLAELGQMGTNPAERMGTYGIKEDQMDRMVMTIDLMAMFSGKGGIFLAMKGTFQSDPVAAALTKEGAVKGVESGGFTLFSKEEKGQKMTVALRNGHMITGTETDVQKGLDLLAGKGSSLYASKGVREALERGGGKLMVVLCAPEGEKSSKGFDLHAAVFSFQDVSADGTAKFSAVMQCPTAADAEKAQAEMQKDFDGKKAKGLKSFSINRYGEQVVATGEGAIKELMSQ